MKILANKITLCAEIIVFILSLIWYNSTGDFEALFPIIASGVGMVTNLISRYAFRPKIELHHQKTDWGRSPREYTIKNPAIIRIGIDKADRYWELFWNFKLEIRNNSSRDAYSIKIEFINKPEKTLINGEIGKIEPLLANEKREFEVKVSQIISGTHDQADAYLQNNIKELMKDVKVNIKYKSEDDTVYYTVYNWSTDSNRFGVC